MISSIKKQIRENIYVDEAFLSDTAGLKSTEKVIRVIIRSIKKGGKLLIIGNGGSASQAQHFAAELVNRFRLDRKALPALALTTDTSNLTSIGNDAGFDFIFSRQIEALGKKGDVCVALTTSDSEGERNGHSTNLFLALRKAKKLHMTTVGLVSEKTKNLLKLLDYAIIVPSQDTPRIQETHGLIIHIISEEVERKVSK